MITHKSIGYSGRLGNQMFQYAALRSVSLDTGYEIFLPNHLEIKQDGVFDFTNNQWIKYRLDILDCFNIDCEIKDNLTKYLYSESKFEFDNSIFTIPDETSIDGYFQSYKYFENYVEVIRKEFTFKDEILDKCKSIIDNYVNPISIHIRRGDYVNHPSYWVVTPEYISEALQHFTDKEYTFLIFSDDIEWCKQVFSDGVVFMEGNNQFEDLCLMSLCEHNVIANSSFSWWGAWLNKNENKKVIAPSQWFTDNKSLEDLYPKNWIKI
jgi:hypothetical protein